jgi:hypothetical protein
LLNPYRLSDYLQGKRFESDLGSSYYLYLTDVSETFNNASVYAFGFEVLSAEDETVFDSRISHTICYYLDRFFQEHDHVIVYIPSDYDQRDKARLRLFDRWYSRLAPYAVCRELDTARYSFQYDADKLFVVTLFFKNAQRALAELIIYGDLEELAHSGK